MTWIIIGAALAGLTITFLISALMQKKKAIRYLTKNFGDIPNRIYRESDHESIVSYWDIKSAQYKNCEKIDSLTWDDLDMQKTYERINSTQSSVGDEVLYAMLHKQNLDANRLKETERLVHHFELEEASRLKLQYPLFRLGEEPSNGLAAFLDQPNTKRLKYAFLYPLLCILSLLSLLTIFFSHTIGLTSFVIVSLINIFFYYKTKLGLTQQLTTVRYLFSMLKCAEQICKIDDPALSHYAETLKNNYRPMKAITRLSKIFLSNPSSELDFLTEYLKMMFLLDFVFYNLLLTSVSKYTAQCTAIYETIGYLDAVIAVASYRKSLDCYCTPRFTDRDEIVLKQIAHPLLKNPVRNTVTIQRMSLITGSNASGKSTFVKSVAINMILAQTIHTCTAEELSFKPSFLVSSMAVRDSIETGESYYIAELNSLKRVLDGLNENVRCVCFVDEILKGTNTIERIAASSAILQYLSSKNALALVATHDIELTEITQAFCDNFHFRETVTENGIVFDYQIHDGYATTKNAIRLLDFMGYPASVTQQADILARDFETNRIWKRL